jgi:phage terminase Nu1 subunit (DNA packaging protein)
MRQTISQLAQLSGLDRKTVTARLVDAGIESLPDSPRQVKQYESADALPALYIVNGDSGEVIKRERGRVLAAQASRQELKLQQERGELISARAFVDFMQGLNAAIFSYNGSVLPEAEQKAQLEPWQVQTLDDEIRRYLDNFCAFIQRSIDIEITKICPIDASE